MLLRQLVAGLVLLALVSVAYDASLTPVSRAPQGATEGIVFDPETGNHVITYEAESEYTSKGLYQTVYIPATKIDPRVKSRFVRASSGNKIAYRFKIKNGKKSRQNLEMLILAATSIDGFPASPDGWDGSAVENFGGAGLRIGWSFSGSEDLGGLAPGKSLSGFGFKSSDLPGVGLIQLRGATPIQAYAGYGPSQEIADEIEKLDKQNFVAYAAAVPRIPVPDPFDAAAVLTSLRPHVKNDWVAMELLDPDLAVKLDAGFATAIEAARRGNTDGLRRELKALRRLLKGFGKWDDDADRGKEDHDDAPEHRIKTKAWPHPIAKLAARVLDFDLKYIEKRVKGRLD